jgi:uncharacterized protein YqeY
MTLEERINQDTVAAMKARQAERTGTLRMMKAALKNKAIEKRAELSDPEVLAVLATMVKQRRDSIEQFTRGNRPELAEKEEAEIRVIEGYLPSEASEAELDGLVGDAIAALAGAAGARPGPREMGAVIKAVQAALAARNLRADGRRLSELVKKALA